jgi:HAD superfamily hydrolase (TIGR01509 family)
MNPALLALLWDVDGTLAETERDGHRPAFNEAFEDFNLPWHWDVEHYGRLLRITGGFERLLHDMDARPDAPALPDARAGLARALHQSKNAHYAALVARGAIGLRPGVAALLDQCRKEGLRMGIVTTTSRTNVEALLAHALGADWALRFDCVVCGEDVSRKKPDPQAYCLALETLGLRAHQALALEDSPAGVAAAQAAGVPVAVTRSHYFRNASFDCASAVIAVGGDLDAADGWVSRSADAASGPVNLPHLRSWHADTARLAPMQ